ncbi:hypothetical protein FVE85_5167 [Porphyridium purpureum]|uniref:Uncharacterized protein n=1 Tax=Porphyridium purpureum TaxID=35688 RepID=A0A5J4Z325_PORPP|nr:hypothetical protein FVE85_5167 [Porphyridium purpureum]|eukprot:POR9252..scf295_1
MVLMTRKNLLKRTARTRHDLVQVSHCDTPLRKRIKLTLHGDVAISVCNALHGNGLCPSATLGGDGTGAQDFQTCTWESSGQRIRRMCFAESLDNVRCKENNDECPQANTGSSHDEFACKKAVKQSHKHLARKSKPESKSERKPIMSRTQIPTRAVEDEPMPIEICFETTCLTPEPQEKASQLSLSVLISLTENNPVLRASILQENETLEMESPTFGEQTNAHTTDAALIREESGMQAVEERASIQEVSVPEQASATVCKAQKLTQSKTTVLSKKSDSKSISSRDLSRLKVNMVTSQR